MPCVPDPTRGVVPRRITVRPMHHAPLWVPFIFAFEFDSFAGPQPLDPRSEVVVIGNQQCLTRRHPDDEALMAATLGVVLQQSCDDTTAAYLSPTLMIAISGRERVFLTARLQI